MLNRIIEKRNLCLKKMTESKLTEIKILNKSLQASGYDIGTMLYKHCELSLSACEIKFIEPASRKKC